jgi:pimeloyl-ACP methyl ester carboxylesterase
MPPTIDHRMIKTNGVTLHVAQAGAEDAPLVLMLHGFPEFWYGWRKQIEYLAANGYRVWVPDQRGYNLSEKPSGINAYRLLDAAGVESAYLVGHDWGAGVAWAAALAHPQRFKKLVIMNVPHPKVLADNLRSNPKQMLKSWYIGFFQLPLLPEALLSAGSYSGMVRALVGSGTPRTFSDADIREYVAAWQQPGALTAMINWYRAVVRHQPPMPDDPRIHIPTLVIWGAKDVALTREMAQQSVAYCDDGRLVMFEAATHWVHHDETEGVNALLSEFLR